MFNFEGDVVLSKSWLNRALIIKHFNPNLELKYNSDQLSDDVLFLKKALDVIKQNSHFEMGLGGTTFRFFSFLISRYSGDYKLSLHQRLAERPQSDLAEILKQLSVSCSFEGSSCHIKSKGWSWNSPVQCSGAISSQFISGLLLSCWGLPKELTLVVQKPLVSQSYLEMTITLLQQVGMNIQRSESDEKITLLIEPNQKSSINFLKAEVDVSSAFSLATAAVVDGSATINNWNIESSQPDYEFLNIFKQMKIDFAEGHNQLKIQKQSQWKAIEADLKNSPDLFPVLAVLCSLAEGISNLHGAEHLKLKESDRIAKTNELLQLVGCKAEVKPDGLVIYGKTASKNFDTQLPYDVDHDHRLAMAAGVLKLAGYPIKISNPEVVNKSYPNFWKDIGLV